MAIHTCDVSGCSGNILRGDLSLLKLLEQIALFWILLHIEEQAWQPYCNGVEIAKSATEQSHIHAEWENYVQDVAPSPSKQLKKKKKAIESSMWEQCQTDVYVTDLFNYNLSKIPKLSMHLHMPKGLVQYSATYCNMRKVPCKKLAILLTSKSNNTGLIRKWNVDLVNQINFTLFWITINA